MGSVLVVGYVFGDSGFDELFGCCADEAVDRFSVFEDEEGWYALDLEGVGDDRVLIHVQFPKGYFSSILLGQLVDDGGDHSARPAPGGPEVDHHERCLGDSVLERLVC